MERMAASHKGRDEQKEVQAETTATATKTLLENTKNCQLVTIL